MNFDNRSTSSCAVLFQTHAWTVEIASRYQKLCEEVGGVNDVFLLYQEDMELHDLLLPPQSYKFNQGNLEQRLGISFLSNRGIFPGSCHFPLIDFALAHTYDYYLIIEYDVFYTGNWGVFLKQLGDNSADLLVSHFENYRQRPNWRWWSSLRSPNECFDLTNEGCKGFFPIYRISKQALNIVHQAHQAGWIGHCETIIPTVLQGSGRSIVDFNMIIPSYSPGGQEPADSVYSSMRWRPFINPRELRLSRQPYLYHPVKLIESKRNRIGKLFSRFQRSALQKK